jgi:Tfp pilus assembly protein FimT
MKISNLIDNRIKGFTVLEAVISMVLTGLIVLLAYAGIRYYHQLFFSITQVGEKQTEINLLHNALLTDTEKAEQVVFNTKLEFISNHGITSYEFSKHFLVRNTAISIDTFFIDHKPPKIVFSEVKVDLVKLISLECLNKEMVYTITIGKDYPLGLTFDEIK